MNKKALFCTLVLLPLQPAFALTNYICQVNGKAVYTTQKVSQACQVSEMNGIAEERISVERTENPSPPERSASAPNTVLLTSQANLYGEPTFNFTRTDETDQIAKIWEKEQFGSYDDVKIVPRADTGSDPKANDLNVKLRNQPAKKPTPVKATTRMPVYTPPAVPAKPKLSRKQILQREIASEQAALVRAQAQLARAKKSGKGNITELQQTVRDRTANVRAIQSELKRQ